MNRYIDIALYGELFGGLSSAAIHFQEALNKKCDGSLQYLDSIRKLWRDAMPILLREKRIDTYFVDWTKIFTPIEYDAWCCIRASGLPFYPQIPVGSRIVDFGDPFTKIAIECDGKKYHNHKKDTARDFELLDIGWTTYRITGRECVAPDYFDDEDPDSMDVYAFKHWLRTSATGVIRCIAIAHYGASYAGITDEDVFSVLNSHTVAFEAEGY